MSLGTAVARADLTPGDPAPPIKVGSWLKGDPIPELEKGKVYVVELWATWCVPCRMLIPHLTELAKKYKDVTFIGVSVMEHDDSAVAPFVKEMGDKMDYHVAMDNKDASEKGAMVETWMDADGQSGIPTAYIINSRGQVAWIGHAGKLEEPLQQILEGKYDLSEATETFKSERAEQKALDAASPEIETKILQPIRDMKYAEALAAIAEMQKQKPELKKPLTDYKVHALVRSGDLKSAYAAIDEETNNPKTSPGILSGIAWKVMTGPDFAKDRDLKRAVAWAQRGVDQGKGDNAFSFHVLARAQAMQGDFEKASETEQKALDKAADDEKSEVEASLKAYKEKKVPEAEKE